MAYETPAEITRTNDLLDRVAINLATLIKWAEADAETSTESGATSQAEDDDARVRYLKCALQDIKDSYRN